MAEAVHARENGENFSQVRNVLHCEPEELQQSNVLLDLFILLFLGQILPYLCICCCFGFKFPK